MLSEIKKILDNFIIKDRKYYMVDCTLGCGGHSLFLLNVFLNYIK